MSKEISDYFKKHLSNWYGKTDTQDCITYVYHKRMGNQWLFPLRQNFHIPLDEEILFSRDTSFWSSRNQGLVLTDNAIYVITDNDRPSEYVVLPWIDVNRIDYKEGIFFFNNDESLYLSNNFFFKGVSMSELENGLGNSLAKHLTEMARLAGERVDYDQQIAELQDQGKFDEALQLIEMLLDNPDYSNNPEVHFIKAKVMVLKEQQLEDVDEERVATIEKEFNKATELSSEKNFKAYCDFWRAFLYGYIGKGMESRKHFILAMASNSEEQRDDARKGLIAMEEGLSEVWDNYCTKFQYNDRKFLMPIRDNEIAGCAVEGIETFRLSNLPGCIKFPIGHPVANELYIGHPYNPNLYVPFAESEDIFFLDKVDEYIRLLQCLGAEEIEITSVKGKSVSEFENRTTQLSAHVDVSAFNGDGNGTFESAREQNRESQLKHSFKIKCDPMRYPYVPDDLIWYNEQPRWWRMRESRLEANRLEYSESISSTETRFVSNTERKDIQVAAQYLWAKANGSAEFNLKSQFKEHTETQWRIDVKFRSLRDFNTMSAAQCKVEQYSLAEQEYFEEIKFTLEDGEIGPRERKTLERTRVRLGISEDRAAEIEASLAPKLTDEEKEYLEEVKAVLEDGEIGPRERKYLERIRIRVGISEERAKEIESL